MIPAHKKAETVKRYLLGTLPDRDAQAIEERSFLDEAVFQEIEVAERVLIEDYLRKHLTGDERAAFEARYLRIPFLRRKFEAIRREEPALQVRLLRWAVAGASAILVAAGIGTFLRIQHAKSAPPSAANVGPPEAARPAPIILALVPVLKKGSSESPRLVLPPAGAEISIQALLAGPARSRSYAARLLRLDQDSHREVWRGNSAPTGQQVNLTVDASLLRWGDYLLELEGEGGTGQETYFFTVVEK